MRKPSLEDDAHKKERLLKTNPFNDVPTREGAVTEGVVSTAHTPTYLLLRTGGGGKVQVATGHALESQR